MFAVKAASSSGGLGDLALRKTMLVKNSACPTFANLQFSNHIINASAARGGA